MILGSMYTALFIKVHFGAYLFPCIGYCALCSYAHRVWFALQLNEIDFQDSLKTVGFSEELQKELLQQYLENRAGIRLIQKEMCMDLPHYHNLEWRFDIQVGYKLS
jgi:hypothetical protein